MSVTYLCGAHLCMDEATCSYMLRGVRVYLCADHLRELGRKTSLSIKEIAEKLPEFEWIGDEMREEESA
jgi:hypothetical protein